ncbi:hypothetical protein SISSUDRAFT_850906 [Sistotremastrum suecicum HHB10207 ss-3]|uniref:Uncharacterized protein n=1 Tax=Sistotremastrum suecicum HHB10207 ss-3 TaxID=1314776 RepID=A0A166HLI3_9AGAM|nr:hypothetical protein SISSUDRAFT_850906 [Sistotremastrum suecicum HHB10207 ss-3]
MSCCAVFVPSASLAKIGAKMATRLFYHLFVFSRPENVPPSLQAFHKFFRTSTCFVVWLLHRHGSFDAHRRARCLSIECYNKSGRQQLTKITSRIRPWCLKSRGGLCIYASAAMRSVYCCRRPQGRLGFKLCLLGSQRVKLIEILTCLVCCRALSHSLIYLSCRAKPRVQKGSQGSLVTVCRVRNNQSFASGRFGTKSDHHFHGCLGFGKKDIFQSQCSQGNA